MVIFCLPGASGADAVAPRQSFLDNGKVRIGVDLTIGGAITYLSKSNSDVNLVNSSDWGRQIQMSFYSGPNPFAPNGKHPEKSWEGLGWNPIQSGDCFGNRSQVLETRNDGKTLYVKSVPMQWPLDNEPGECTFETWITLDGAAAKVRSRIVNHRLDTTQYPGRGQELPAIYTNGPWYRLMTYTGDKPFTEDALKQIPCQFPWAGWQGTENWAALVDDRNWGLGVWEPSVQAFSGGFSGTPGAGGPHDGATGYIAPLHYEILDHNINYDYRYVLILGNLNEIRRYVYEHAPKSAPPNYKFQSDRQHWRYTNATDTGWPIHGELRVRTDAADPQLIGPDAFWLASAAPKLSLEAAFPKGQTHASLYWKQNDGQGFRETTQMTFEVIPDGKFHHYKVNLASSPEYTGAITGLRLDPEMGKPGDLLRLKSIGFTR
ncbi:MAG: hypothetical protein ABIY70_26370 [Capsulimonas sp.]|uniref:hypothetical protein n=1 Tax=Capsulimonas sp. TaxID=2494211 RepID=UPI0032635D19